jgi:hypothetical protein
MRIFKCDATSESPFTPPSSTRIIMTWLLKINGSGPPMFEYVYDSPSPRLRCRAEVEHASDEISDH